MNQDIVKLKKEILKKRNEFNVIDQIRDLDNLKESEVPNFIDIEEGEDKIRKMYAQFKHGATVHSILLCPISDKCVHYDICPFKDNESFKDLKGKRCPLEYELFVDTVKKMSESYGVESIDYIAYQYILEYAELEILDMRISSYINSGKHSGIIVQEFRTVTEKGDAVFGDEISKAIEIKEKIKNRKDKILKELVMTPNSKMKAKNTEKGGHELSKHIEMLKKTASALINLQESINIDPKEIIDGEIIDE